MKKECNGCKPNNEESFALQLVRSYKKMFLLTTTILTSIILLLFCYIAIDTYCDNNEAHCEKCQIILADNSDSGGV